MIALQMVERLIFESSLTKLIIILFFIMYVKSGIWFIPNIEGWRILTHNPFTNPFIQDPLSHYVVTSWLGPFLAWLLNIRSFSNFFIFHLAFSLAFTALFIGAIYRKFGNKNMRYSLIIFFALPVSYTPYFWVGLDSITLFLFILALSLPRIPVVFSSGALIGMNHFEQGFFASFWLMISTLINRRFHYQIPISTGRAILFFISVILGKIFLILIFYIFKIETNLGRIVWALTHWKGLLLAIFLYWQIIFWSVLGIGWFVAIRFADLGKKAIPFFISIFGVLCVAPLVADQTRVLSIVSFPLVATHWLLNEEFLNRIRRKEVAILFLLWLFMPIVWAWGGRPKWSIFPYNVMYLLNRLFGWFVVPENGNLAMWPF